jgi:hypothetical protein
MKQLTLEIKKNDIKVGDILQIKGALGFDFNPQKEVIEIREQENGYVSVLLDMYPKREKGLLAHMNQTWHGLELLKYEIIK